MILFLFGASLVVLALAVPLVIAVILLEDAVKERNAWQEAFIQCGKNGEDPTYVMHKLADTLPAERGAIIKKASRYLKRNE